MKQNKDKNGSNADHFIAKTSRRKELSRLPRTLILLLILFMLAASLLAAYARFRTVVFPVPTPVFRFSRDTDVIYQVQNEKSGFMDQSIQGMDMVYLSEYARSILPVIRYEIIGNKPVSISGYYQMVAILRMRDQSDPAQVIFEKTLPLSDQVRIDINDKNLKIEQSAQIDLEEIRSLMHSFEQETEITAVYELEAGLQTDFAISSGSQQLVNLQERPGLVFALGNDTFTVRKLPLPELNDTIWRMQRWQLYLTPMPTWIYPAAILLCLSLFLFFIFTTKSRKRQHFNKQLKRMMRKAKGRLMLIGDKAWEPEWCITASNFDTMVKTARKLKHPIFCYIDRESPVPSALFYVYYGENNYCYVYSGKPDNKWYKDKTAYNNGFSAKPEKDEPLFTLPETPELTKDDSDSKNI